MQRTNKHQIFLAHQKSWQQRCQRLTVRQKNSSYSKTCFKLESPPTNNRARENTQFSLTTARRRLANFSEHDRNNKNQHKRRNCLIQKTIRKNTISGQRQVQVGEPHIRSGEPNLPRFLRNLLEAGTGGIRGRRAQVYRDIVLRKNARPPQKSTKRSPP